MARILVVDDDEAVRKLFRRILEHAGHDVAEATDGAAGLSAYRADPHDMVITDIVMPGTDGLELIMELWRDYPDVKVVAVSGGGKRLPSDMCLDHARVFGALRTIPKPVAVQALLDAVDEVLGEPAN